MNSKPGIVKEVVSGDTIIVRAQPRNGPPSEKKIVLTNIVAPKLAGRGRNREDTKEEPYAWESREYVRKRLIGQSVHFLVQPRGENARTSSLDYGSIFFPTKDDNFAEELVAAGLVSVKDNSKQPSPEVQALLELEKKAKSEGKGKWDTNAKQKVRTVNTVPEKLENFMKTHGKKPIDAIIEAVLNGSTVKALLLPDFYEITLLISGIRCDLPDEDLKSQAKFCVESKVLQRDVQVIIEGVMNNKLTGSIIHPKGDIAEVLLREGFASCVDRSLVFVTNGGAKLRAAERYAKENKKGKWATYEDTGPKGPVKEFQGTVLEIIGAEGMVVKTATGESERLFLASIKPPRADIAKKDPADFSNVDGKPATPTRGRPIFDTDWLFEAREFLRKKLIGKKVNVSVDYVQPERDGYREKMCCTVTINGANIAEELVENGYATVIPHRQDDENKSLHYDALLQAQQKASENQVGLHNKKEVPKHRIIDLTADANRAKKMLPLLQRATSLDAIVEFVTRGARMRLFLPKDETIITFLLSGVECPRGAVAPRNGRIQQQDEPEPYGEEALLFTREKVMHRDVQIKIESCDKFGNFIGWLFINNVNLSLALVKAGLARVHQASAGRSEYYRELAQAEEHAKMQKLKIWEHEREETKDEPLDETAERTVNYITVNIAGITRELHIYAQYVQDKDAVLRLQEDLQQQMSSYTPTGDYRPRKGELCAAKYEDDLWYRAKVQKPMGQKAQIQYVDYGNTKDISIKDLAPLPYGLNSAKPYAHEYGIACVKLPPKDYIDDVIATLYDVFNDRELCINVEYKEQNLEYVSIVDAETKEDNIKKAVSLGCFLVDERKEKKLQSLVAEYLEEQEKAKKAHELIWEYGDIREDDAREFGVKFV